MDPLIDWNEPVLMNIWTTCLFFRLKSTFLISWREEIILFSYFLFGQQRISQIDLMINWHNKKVRSCCFWIRNWFFGRLPNILTGTLLSSFEFGGTILWLIFPFRNHLKDFLKIWIMKGFDDSRVFQTKLFAIHPIRWRIRVYKKDEIFRI